MQQSKETFPSSPTLAQISNQGPQSNGLTQFFNTVSNNLANSVSQLVEDIENANQDPEQQPPLQCVNEEQTSNQDQVCQQVDENLSKIQQIRRQQNVLLEQLKILRDQEQELLRKNSKNSEQNFNYQKQQDKQAEGEDSSPDKNQQQQYNFFYFKNVIVQKPSSPPRRMPRKYIKPKIKMPDPVVPQLSRLQFENKIKQMAGHIRSKVQKQNPLLVKQLQKSKHIDPKKSKSTTSKQVRKLQKFIVQLPEISPRKGKNNPDVLLNTFWAQNNQQNQQIQDNTTGNLERQSKKLQKSMKSIVDQIIKATFDKIRYKQKYELKLDPINHKYPMTSFRRKIISQKHQKEKERSMSSSLRASMLNQRKSIQSRYK